MDGRHVNTAVVSVLALIVLYALSIGPAVLLMDKGIIPEKTIFAYDPIIFVAEHVACVSGPLFAYIQLWDPGFPQLPDPD